MTERELSRRAGHRPAVLRHVEVVSGSVAATCRSYGISRNCYYKWLHRYEAEGLEGLKGCSSRPHHRPTTTDTEVIEVDVTFIEPLCQAGWRRKYYQFAAIDDCTRLRSCGSTRAATRRPRSISSTTSWSKLPVAVEPVQTGNGQEFGASFHRHLLDRGVGHVYIRPRTPRLNGKVERSLAPHRFRGVLPAPRRAGSSMPPTWSPKLQEREDYSNYDRPHCALGGQTLYERLRQKAQDPLS